MGDGKVIAVALNAGHHFSKTLVDAIELIAGEGVVGDAHCGTLVKHRSRVATDPSQPNLRQVHLVHSELFDELSANGFDVKPADIGENITTRGIDLLALPLDSLLHVGSTVISVTGLRNPCHQLNKFAPGLMNAVLDKADDGNLIRKAGIMGVVLVSGVIRCGDDINVQLPTPPHSRLKPV
jgi:MOSC domain-containing protein YiiM